MTANRFKAVDAANQGAFSGTARAADHHYLVGFDVKVDVLQYVQLIEPFVDILKGDHSVRLPGNGQSACAAPVFSVYTAVAENIFRLDIKIWDFLGIWCLEFDISEHPKAIIASLRITFNFVHNNIDPVS
jgi:hypothetical protein